ncbi:hypothetical protein A1507_13515 [Methylomonas koyamae]|uniref:Uncharacterized protein n=1 Tax=Methylomonas koyamae TaxID=702114 RepID=A0A177ND51_9GAMM|nr:hypothetical protein A1507_13515 [Methylomonas koyamae]
MAMARCGKNNQYRLTHEELSVKICKIAEITEFCGYRAVVSAFGNIRFNLMGYWISLEVGDDCYAL